MIQTPDADIKLVVVSPKILRNEKCQREFEKVAISQRKLGFAMHGDLIDGTIIIENSGYFYELKKQCFTRGTVLIFYFQTSILF